MPHRWAEKPPRKTKKMELNELQRSEEMLQETMQKPAFDSLPEKQISETSKKKKKTPNHLLFSSLFFFPCKPKYMKIL